MMELSQRVSTKNGIDSDSDGIQAQRINAYGDILWMMGGVNVGSSSCFDITTDCSGGAIVAYGNSDIYAQRVNAFGFTQWGAIGACVCNADDIQSCRAISSNGSGGAIIAWEDARNYDTGDDIYAQQVNADGVNQWLTNGIPICTTPNDKSIIIVSDGSYGATIVWHSYITGTGHDIYAQRVNDTGEVQWTINGKAICTVIGDQYGHQAITDGEGGAIISWKDLRCDNSCVYAQRVTSSGGFVATFLRDFSVKLADSSIQIDWILSEVDDNVEFYVERASALDQSFTTLSKEVIAREYLSFSFIDYDLEPAASYRYRVGLEYGSSRKTLFETDPIKVPKVSSNLYQNIPNPFNPSTAIKYYLSNNCWVKLEIYDISGSRIACLVDKEQKHGSYTINWEGRNNRGDHVASGVYFYMLKAGKEVYSKKMILLR